MPKAQTFYDLSRDALVMVSNNATARYWDQLWRDSQKDIKKAVTQRYNYMLRKFVPRYLSQGAKILDAGCGVGDKVYMLKKMGYDAYGVDFAEETVKRVTAYFPDINIKCADVRGLSFPDKMFDAYLSFGVIEHFFEGYGEVIDEARRVLCDKGYLFLAFPHISPLRRWKIRFNRYSHITMPEQTKEKFYQFFLNVPEVIREVESKGFSVVSVYPFDAVKGWKDEVSLLNPAFSYIYNSQHIFLKGVKFFIDRLTSFLAGHTVLIIFQKNV
ncbi:MAG: methyltransferase domain-containing protein [Candidatus Omnitrophica bacterium]|nr:methyltransferase domain-containing protein [Candidatus Omnitrophota bacterium]